MIPNDFTPCLVCGADNFGNIGQETDIEDMLGNKLSVGDTVMLYRDKNKYGERVVCKQDSTAFILGFYKDTWSNGSVTCCDTQYNMIKSRTYVEMKNGEQVNHIKYVLQNTTSITPKDRLMDEIYSIGFLRLPATTYEAIANRVIKELPSILADTNWVQFPCKIGDTIYFADAVNTRRNSAAEITSVSAEKDDMIFEWAQFDEDPEGSPEVWDAGEVYLSNLGKTWFLSYKDAKKYKTSQSIKK